MKKICKRCGRNRKIGKFGILSCKPDGKNIYCRDCMKEIRGRYNNTLKGIVLKKKSSKKWKKNNKEKIKEYNKQYYKKKKHIILYNKKARKETESVLIFENPKKNEQRKINKDRKEYDFEINPKRKGNG